MEKILTMNGGEGPNSYLRNSTVQDELNGQAKILLMSSIEEALELQKHHSIFSIADLGCSVGPNTFKCVGNIIEAVQRKFTSSSNNNNNGDDIIKLPEFVVFFNDHVSNDFNTLFKSFPLHRQYMVAAVPGSFHSRIFPKSSINLMHSSFSLHWLSKVPEEVAKEGSALWNKGRITYAQSSIEIMEAFRNQFINDLEVFLKARSEELVPGGLLLILMCCRPEGPLSKGKGSHIIKLYDLLGDAINDLAKQGVVNEEMVGSFNVPLFTPSASEVTHVISNMKNLTIKKMDKIFMSPKLNTPEEIELSFMMIRAVMESAVREHFGSNNISNIEELIFSKYRKKLEEFAQMPSFDRTEKVEFLFMSLKLLSHASS